MAILPSVWKTRSIRRRSPRLKKCPPKHRRLFVRRHCARLIAIGKSLGYRDADKLTLFVVLATFAYLGIILTLAQGFLVRRLSGRMSEGTMATGGARNRDLGLRALGRGGPA